MCACIDGPSGSGNPNSPTDMSADQGADMTVTPPEDMGIDMPPVDMSDVLEDMPEDMSDVDPPDMSDMADPQDMSEGPRFNCDTSNKPNPLGGGEADDPYIICFPENLVFMNNSTKHFVLGRDIDVGGNWEPIPSFHGHFDGQGFKIEGLFLDNENVSKAMGTCMGRLSPRFDGRFQGNYVGAFISALSASATIENVDFAEIKVGEIDERISYPFTLKVGEAGTEENIRCYPLMGGLFGLIGGDGETPATLRNIRIQGLEAHVGGSFGGLAFEARSPNIDNVHVLKGAAVPSINVTNTHTSGFITYAEQPRISSSSVHLNIAISGETITSPNIAASTFADTALFVGYVTGGTFERVVANGSIQTLAIHGAPIQGSLGGLIGVARSAEQHGPVEISDCLVNVSIDADNNAVGGVIGRADVFFHPQTIRDCGVGVVGRTPASLVARKFTGAIFGQVDDNGMSTIDQGIVLENVFSLADLGEDSVGCVFGQGDFNSATFGRTYTKISPESDETFMFAGEVLNCSARVFLETLEADELNTIGWLRRADDTYVPAAIAPMLDEIGFFGP